MDAVLHMPSNTFLLRTNKHEDFPQQGMDSCLVFQTALQKS
jgi:hypothetical protein